MSLPEKEKEAASGSSPIGARLRDIRQKRGLTLQQVADGTGFALSFLSLLERDKVTVTIDNLSRLARFYAVRMVSLFESAEAEPVLVFRAAALEERARGVGPGSAAFTLLADRHSRQLEPLHVVIGPGGGDPEFRSHEGESLIFVLEGAVEIFERSGERTLISAGDAAWYLGSRPRRVANASAEARAVLLIATAPPTDRRDRVVDTESGIIVQSEED